MMFLTFLFLCAALLQGAYGQTCTDNNNYQWTVTTGLDFSTTTYNSCPELVAAHKWYCRQGEQFGSVTVRDVCCASCASIAPDVCADKPVIYTYKDGKYFCPEYVQAYPGVCDPDNDRYITDACCESCSGLSQQVLNCYDNNFRVFAAFTSADGTVGYFDDCDDFTSTFPYYCRDDATIINSGQTYFTRDECCDSCKNVDADICADKPFIVSDGVNNYMCDTMPKNPFCGPYEEQCCATCNEPAPVGCHDSVNEYIFRVSSDTVGGVDSYLTCAALIAEHPYYCRPEAFMIINEETVYTRDACCVSCQNIPEDVCADKPLVVTIGSSGQFMCDTLAATFPDYCDPDSIVGTSDYSELCCASCSGLSCYDSSFLSYTVTIHRDGNTKTYTDCSLLATDYPYFCNENTYITVSGNTVYTRDSCCASCATVAADVCADRPSRWVVDDKGYLCGHLVSKFPEVCDPDYSNNEVGDCCESCNVVDPNCYDSGRYTYSAITNKNGFVKTYNTCSKLVTAHPWYCRADATQRINNADLSTRELCCESCTGVDENLCVDKPQSIDYNGKKYMCSNLIANFPAFCHPDAEGDFDVTCCHSCSSVDINCVDSLSLYTYAFLGINSATCSSAINKRPGLCAHGSSDNGLADDCCASCDGFDSSCYDDPFFTFLWKGNVKYCHQAGSVTSNLRLKACCENNGEYLAGTYQDGEVDYVKDACCLKCSEIQCP